MGEEPTSRPGWALQMFRFSVLATGTEGQDPEQAGHPSGAMPSGV